MNPTTIKSDETSESAIDLLLVPLSQARPVADASVSALVLLVEEAVTSARRQDMGELGAKLGQSLTQRLRAATEPVRAAVLGLAGASQDIQAAYLLGKLSFAQHLVSAAYAGRADDSFLPALTNPMYREYVLALLTRDLTPRELAKVLPELEAAVVHKLRRLVTLGIVDFRREGSDFLYSPTPLARNASIAPCHG